MVSKLSIEAGGQYDFAGMVTSSAFAGVALLVGAVGLVSLNSATKRFSKWRANGHMSLWAIFVGLSVLHLALAFVFGLAVFFTSTPSSNLLLACVIELVTGGLGVILVGLPMVAIAIRHDDIY